MSGSTYCMARQGKESIAEGEMIRLCFFCLFFANFRYGEVPLALARQTVESGNLDK